MATVTISGAGDHVTAAGTDRIPASKASVKGYITPAYIGTYLAQNTLAAGTLTASAPMTLTQTWNNSGVTFQSFRVEITDTASAAASSLINLLVGGTTQFSVNKSGSAAVSSAGIYSFSSRSRISSPADNQLLLRGAGADFTLLQFGGTTSSFPALKRSTTSLQVRLADDSADASLSASRLLTPKSAELTIASGVITVTGGYHDVDTEADAASDDLDTISGGVDGAILILRANNDARTVVVKDGTGNIQCGGDRTLDNTQDTVTLLFSSTLSAWLEIAFAANGA